MGAGRVSKQDIHLASILKKEYFALRKSGIDPKAACAQLGPLHDGESMNALTVERVRQLVSWKGRVRVCRQCFVEFKPRWQEKYHWCPACYYGYKKEHGKRYATQYKKSTLAKGSKGRKFYTPDELAVYARRSLHMTAQQFGEALADVAVRPRYINHQ